VFQKKSVLRSWWRSVTQSMIYGVSGSMINNVTLLMKRNARTLRRRFVTKKPPSVILFKVKSVTLSMKMNVRLFTKRDALLNMNLNAPQNTWRRASPPMAEVTYCSPPTARENR